MENVADGTDTSPPVGSGSAGPDAEPNDGPDEEPDAARAALARTRAMRRRPMRSARSRAVRSDTRRENLKSRKVSPGYTAPGADEFDPVTVGSLLGDWIKDEGWERPVTEARVFAEWPQLVGADIARRSVPVSLENGELRITAETTAWATQLRLLSATMLARLVAELGPDIVTKLVITGPVGPSWKHGRLSVRGARGPRDTYG